MNLLLKPKRHSDLRHGISVVEVLSAMVVALIGVFGVMVLIPFSVQQAQSGLDKDEAATVGRNAFAQFEIEGFRFVQPIQVGQNEVLATRIANNNNDPNDPAVLIGVNPGVAVIDPLSKQSNEAPLFCGFNTFNLLDTNNVPLTLAAARKMCRSTDDLQFQVAADNPPAGVDQALLPPQQIFDVTATGSDARRQSLGRISWNAVLVPVKTDYANQPSGGTPGLTFRMHVLVHKDRDLDRDGTLVDYPAANITSPAVPTTLYGGGTVQVDSWLTNPSAVKPINEPNKVRRDDWVMLRNERNTEAGYQDEVGFYRVTGVTENGNTLTLDGPDFTLRPGTKLHHLVVSRDGQRSGKVINVYERTMRWERKSNWN